MPPKKRRHGGHKSAKRHDGEVDRHHNNNTPEFRNIRFTKDEDAKISNAFKEVAESKGMTAEELWERFQEEDDSGRKKCFKERHCLWFNVAALTGLKRRSTAAIRLRCFRIKTPRRFLQRGHWSKEETTLLREAVAEHGNKWTFIAKKFGCADYEAKWKMNGLRLTTGDWSPNESWQLRQAILEITESVAPTKDIPWVRVQTQVPTRSTKQCCDHWYLNLLPSMAHYVEKHGYPIEPPVFERLMLRYMSKLDINDDGEIQFREVNPYHSSLQNRRVWARLQLSLPDSLGGGFFRGSPAPFKDRLAHLLKSRRVNDHKQVDQRLLKCAKLAPDFDQRCEEDVAEAEPHAHERGAVAMIKRSDNQRKLKKCEEAMDVRPIM